MNKIKRIFIILFICLITINFNISVVNCLASVDDEQTIRVGVFPLGKFMYFDDDGEPNGYNIEYLNKIAEFAHWNYEYVKYKNWVDARQGLANNEIDLLAPAQISSRNSQFDYSAIQMGIESAAIYCLSDRDDLSYEDFETMSKIKFGGAEGTTFSKKFVDEYCVNAGFKPDIQYYPDMTDLLDALGRGEIDAAITNVMYADDQYKLLGQFSMLPVYYIVQKNNSQLLEKLNAVMTDIMTNYPSYQINLINEYFPIYNTTNFTFDERKYIENISSVTIGYGADYAPVSYKNEKGQFSGIARDVLDKVSQNLGIKFNYIEVPMDNLNRKYMERNKIDFVIGNEYDNYDENSVLISNQFLDSEIVWVANSNMTFDGNCKYRVAVLKNLREVITKIKKDYPNFQVVEYPSIEDCFNAVRSGQVDILVQNRYIVENYLIRPKFNNLVVLPVQSIEDGYYLIDFNYGNNSSKINQKVNNRIFVSIVDKAINQLTSKEVNSIIIQNTSKSVYNYTIFDILYQYWFVITLVILIFILLLLVILSKQRSTQILKIKNEQLNLAVKSAEKANGAKSRFLAQMSHEIRTPMNAIIGLTSIAENEIDSPQKVKDYLAKIEGSSKILLGIINDILDMSSIENNKMKIAQEPFDFKQLIVSVSTIFYQQAKQKGIEFETKMNNVTEEYLIGDQLRVNQIFMNLLSNAVKFTPSGGKITLSIIQASKRQNKVQFRFVVEDTGCGMTDELKSRLFKPFEQESATTAHKYGGSGLGLSITKNIVELMGGSIKVESQKGFGSTFTVDVQFEFQEKKHEKPDVDIKNVRTLVIDDDEDSCKYAGLILDRIGVEHSYITDGEKALEMLGQAEEDGNPFKLCIVDWKMPKMSGIEVIKEIRKIFGNDAIIIMASAYELSEIEDIGREIGVNYFASKPLFQSTVFDAIMKVAYNEFNSEDSYKSNETGFNFSGKRVLIAEDVPINMEVAVKLLDMVGIKSEPAENGQEAVDMFNQKGEDYYDAILLDINMPVMNGYAAAKLIRKSNLKYATSVPIYAMTANAFTDDVASALDAGMNGHIAKPIETQNLYETLEKGFENKI